MPTNRSGTLFSTLMFFWLSGGAALADAPAQPPEDNAGEDRVLAFDMEDGAVAESREKSSLGD